jgi:hypothetical protein
MATRRTTPSARSPESPQPAQKAAPPRRTPPASPSSASGTAPRVTVSADKRRAMIEEAAYLRAERRGFAPGFEVEDWLAAEAEVDALLKGGHGGTPQ